MAKCINTDNWCECARVGCIYNHKEIIDINHNPNDNNRTKTN